MFVDNARNYLECCPQILSAIGNEMCGIFRLLIEDLLRDLHHVFAVPNSVNNKILIIII